jgi:3-oxoacyl-[acyl-carrier protein] reductase
MLTGRNVIVTGASRGLGSEIARSMARAGAQLLLIARSRDALSELGAELGARTMAIDLAHRGAGDRIVSSALEAWDRIDVLVNNAGMIGPIGPAWENEAEAWERTLRVNLVAPVELCRASIPHIPAGGRIINISGGGASAPRPRFSAYATAKAGLVRFSETLAAELAHSGINVNCIAPGALPTKMMETVREAGRERAGADEYARAEKMTGVAGDALARAAALAVFLASEAGDGITGRLISAVWDPWESLSRHLAELKDSDVYTLRRIRPAERGFTWGER